ncbi:putative polyketide synthase [Xylaria venustula]|nr:putative polyketide synthase [Xylaria venustula]
MASPATQHLLLFGDQTVEKLSSIQALIRSSKTSSAARRFLQEATDVLQLEFAKLSKLEHGWNQDFDSLLSLAESNQDQNGVANGMIATLLMCIGRLGRLIVAAEQDPTILGSTYNPVQILGFCTGALPAATIIAARDTSEMFDLAREIISITFRMAYEIRRRMILIEDVPKSWAKTYLGLSVETVEGILNEFHENQHIAPLRRVSIGVVSQEWITLFGAPSSLERLEAWSREISNAAHVNTDAGGPIHSRNMPPMNLDLVLGNSHLLNTQLDWSKVRMLSPASCQEFRHETLRSLLQEIVKDIAHNVLRAGDTIETFVSGLDSERSFNLLVLGPTGHLPALEQTLKNNNIRYSQVKEATSVQINQTRGGSDLIAIVGMSGRFPGSNDVEKFWESLQEGKCHIREVPKSRFDLDEYYDTTGEKKNSTLAKHGAFLDDPGLFDHRLFNVSPREAGQMDPIQRLLLTTSYEALEYAGYTFDGTPATRKNRIATYFGQSSDDWHEILDNEGPDIYYVTSLCRAFAPGKLNYHYKWGGGSFAVDSACASSMTSVSLACSALNARECDTALAGGGAIYDSPNGFSGCSRAGMISKTGGCRTFHHDADGYARGEAVAVVVLKRLEDAIAENDNVLGVIRGATRTYSSTATSITHPSHVSQERTYQDVFRQSALNADEISYVELHGTGTQAGDFEEMTSVLNVVGKKRTKENPLTVGAVKAAVGHGEAVAGVTSLIKVLLMMRDRVIPPQPGWPFKLNEHFPPLDKLNVKIATKKMDLKPSSLGDKKLKILLNSFDASGGNTVLAVEEAPPVPAKAPDPRAAHVVTISARTIGSLRKNRERLLEYLNLHPETNIADLAYSTTARRMHETLRVAYVGKSTGSIVRQLRADVASGGVNDPRVKVKKTSRVFMFTGQGSQYVGMGFDLFKSNKTFAELLDTYEDIALKMGLPRFLHVISDKSVDIASHTATETQLALVSLEMAVANLLKEWGIVPDIVIGHSLGEYAAMNAAGVLSVSDVLYLVGRRAMLMEKHLVPNEYAMLVVSSDMESLPGVFKTLDLRSCDIACINAPSVTVVSGTVRDLQVLEEYMAPKTKTTLLKVPYGFHSAQIEPILGEYRKLAEGVVFTKPQIPMVSTLTGTVEREAGTFTPEYLGRQARETVKFTDALLSLQNTGLIGENSILVEIGPDPFCLGLARRTLSLPSSACLLPAIKSSDDNWSTLSVVLKAAYETGLSVNWTEIHKNYKSSVRLLKLPHYAFDYENFWISYKSPVPAVSQSVVNEKPVPAVLPPQLSGFPTDSVQRVVSEEMGDAEIRVTFSSDISQPGLLRAIEGHRVSGNKMCPLSVFGDMALTAAKYAFFQMHGKEPALKNMHIKDIEMTKALALSDSLPKPIVKIQAIYLLATDTVNITFSSHANGFKQSTHGTCMVEFEDSRVWQDALSRTLFLLKSRISTLQHEGAAGKAHTLLSPIVYKLFSHVVTYGEAYRGLEEVILSSDCNDAIGRVKLPMTKGLGNFLFDPYGVDSVNHLAGFVLNSGLKYPEDTACVTHGMEAWHALEPLIPGKTYTNYVCMQDVPGTSLISADSYVFDGDRLIQVNSGFKFQKINKVVLQSVLGVPNSGVQRTAVPPQGHRTHMNDVTKIPSNSDMATLESYSHILDSSSSDTPIITPDIETPISGRATPATPLDSGADSSLIDSLLSIVARESGCSPEDLNDDTLFADVGIDSLMAITILSIVKREIGLDLEASFFIVNSSVGEAKCALSGGSQSISPSISSVTTDELKIELPPVIEATTNSFPPPVIIVGEEEGRDVMSWREEKSLKSKMDATVVETTEVDFTDDDSVPVSTYHCNVVHLQGSRAVGTQKLFLLADETGSALSYIGLSSLGTNLGVYGVESPFVRDASDYTHNLEELATIFVAALRTEQPTGPYMIGGVSAGAVLAYEVAKQLVDSGAELLGLLLIDPIDANGAEKRLTIGTRSGMKPVQKEHVQKFMLNLATYAPSPMSISPGTSVCILPRQDEGVEETWSARIPGLSCSQIDAPGGSMMKSPTIRRLEIMCREAVGKIRG